MKRYNWVLIWAGLSLVFALIIHIAFNIAAPVKFLEAVWSAGDILTYTSTIALGLLAFWQNQKLYEESYKQEVRNLTIEKYVLFTFEDLEAIFYNENDSSGSWREVKCTAGTGSCVHAQQGQIPVCILAVAKKIIILPAPQSD